MEGYREIPIAPIVSPGVRCHPIIPIKGKKGRPAFPMIPFEKDKKP